MLWWCCLAVLSFAAVIFTPQTVASQRIYRCVDADGQVSFSNDPEQCVNARRPTPPGSGSKPAAEKTEAAPGQGGGERRPTNRDERDDAPPGLRAQLRRRGFQRPLRARRDRDVRAFARELACDGLADAEAAAGDDRALALEPQIHCAPPPSIKLCHYTGP